ncbi:MAG: peptidoglycan bridge formation glycyltransferase FemA/FemB family protein [Candidatus Magasanikbacteria bacterium]|nr:peptidoglycan bridge formation glycyltransferase FemA/FemB family protein [Candidatus Magasanikbacteria bacterium]
MYSIRQITNKEQWNAFTQSQEFILKSQAWNYGEFYVSMGEEFWVLGVYAQDTLIAGALVVSTHAKRGNFLFIPYGPIVSKGSNYREILATLTIYLKKMCIEKNYSFFRISPFDNNTSELQEVYRELGFRKSPIHLLAETTWLLDLRQSRDDIFMAMNKNHRNLIRRCEREGVHVEISTDKKDLDDFNKLLDATAKRHNFVRFSREFVQKEFDAFSTDQNVFILNAYLPDGRLDSSAIIFCYGSMAAYYHGASLMQNKKIPSSYLLQWTAIQEAQKRGLTYYNFWGIAPDGAQKSHPFFGITHFKKGFGGFQKDLLLCQDYIVSPKYWFNWAIESLRRIKRGFNE